jgi:hypothetical protein
MEVGSQDIILKVDHLRTIIMCSHWLKFKKSSCQKPPSQLNCDFAGMVIGWSCTKLVNHLPIGNSRWLFPIGAYVKTMSADGGHLGWRSGSRDIILKVDHLKTIHAMFALN